MAASTAATAAALKKQEIEQGKKNMEQMQQNIGKAMEQTQQSAERADEEFPGTGWCQEEIRDRETGRLQVLTYASLLWQLFRSLIEGALDGLVRELGRKVISKVLAAIDQGVESFLEEALQISAPQVAVQLEAEALGYL